MVKMLYFCKESDFFLLIAITYESSNPPFMKRRQILRMLAFAVTLLFCSGVEGQSYTWEDFLQHYLNVEEENETQLNTLYEELSDLHEHPFNLNEATKEQLEKLPFMSAEETEELLAYLYHYGPMKSLGELDLVPKLEYDTRQMLRLFVYINNLPPKENPFKLRNALKYGKQEILSQVGLPLFYTRSGYRDYPDSVLQRFPNRQYLGNDLYSSLRYEYHYNSKLYFGFSAEKDAGEPFAKRGNTAGYDAWSFHFLMKNIGWLQALALGDYKLTYGEGLTLNTDYILGLSTLIGAVSKAKGIKRHASTDEYSFFRGGAIAVNLGHCTVTAFASLRHLDGTLNKDSTTVSSIKDDGYHRTLLEMSKKGNLKASAVGGNITYQWEGLNVGMTALYNHFDHTLKPGDALFQRYYPRGKSFTNASIDYGFRHWRFYLHGETAMNRDGKMATLNNLWFRVSDKLELTMMQRFYSYRFTTIWGNAPSEGGSVQNESGIFVGLNAEISAKLRCNLYADWSYHPWTKYQISNSSHSLTFCCQALYGFSEQVSLLVRYKLKTRQKDYTDTISGNRLLAYNTQHTIKMQLDIRPSERLSFRTEGDFTSARVPQKRTSRGYMIEQGATYNLDNLFQCTANAAFFCTDDYESRLYAYEKGLLYTFTFPTYYYHGMRAAVLMRCNAGKHWTVIVKYGFTLYFNQQTIGSGTQMINQNYRNDLAIQARLKF